MFLITDQRPRREGKYILKPSSKFQSSHNYVIRCAENVKGLTGFVTSSAELFILTTATRNYMSVEVTCLLNAFKAKLCLYILNVC